MGPVLLVIWCTYALSAGVDHPAKTDTVIVLQSTRVSDTDATTRFLATGIVTPSNG